MIIGWLFYPLSSRFNNWFIRISLDDINSIIDSSSKYIRRWHVRIDSRRSLYGPVHNIIEKNLQIFKLLIELQQKELHNSLG